MDTAELSGYRALIESCAIAPPIPASCLLFSGDDALAWIHGQVTQEIASMKPGDFRQACLCSATGHILSIMSVAALPGRVAMTLPTVSAQAFLDRVETSVFMEDVHAEFAPDAWTPTLVQGPRTRNVLATHGLDMATDAMELPDGEGLAHRLSFGADGVILWSPPSHPLLSTLREELPEATPAHAEAIRLERGFPRWSVDIRDKTLPPEMGAAFVERTVSFNKGCYTGQEVLMRIRTRGHTNRTWVALACEGPVEADSPVSSAVRESAGVVTSSAVSPDFGPIAAAMLHNDSAQEGTEVVIRSGGQAVKASVRPMPLRD